MKTVKMKFRYWKTLLLLLFLGLIVPGFGSTADIATQCEIIAESSSGCPDLSAAECKVLLQKCADYYDEQSNLINQDLTKTSAQKSTLQNQISSLKKKIQGLTADISKGNIMVKDLNIQITDTQKSINQTSEDILNSKNQIETILRTVYEEDQKPSFVILLEGNLSDFFSNLAYLDGLNSRVSSLLDGTINLKSYLQGQQEKMSGNVDQLQKTIALQALQKQQNEKNKLEQDKYLKLTESQYQQQLQDKKEVEQKAAKINAMLFQMVGVSKAPTFGEALEIAKGVGAMIGIRPAFLLAIISQESAIGRNVGQCVITDNLGNGKRISTGVAIAYPRAMHPKRDIPPFFEITAALGRDPYNTPVSCWIPAYVSGQPYGFGGAMGPAQFIASTWMLFQDRLTAILGKAPDPWVIKDSFTASAMYLFDLGAGAQTESTEKKAASRYYGGSSSYANSVYRRATCIQTFINDGTMSSSCQSLIF